MAKVGLNNYGLRAVLNLSDQIEEESNFYDSEAISLPKKKEWVQSYQRRKEQQNCGLSLPINKPYRELGVIDDREFSISNEKDKRSVLFQQKNISKAKPPLTQTKVKLRSISSNQIPPKMLDLYEELKLGSRRIMLVKSGQSLPKLLHDEKENLEQLKATEEAPEEGQKWHPGDAIMELDSTPPTAKEQWRKQSIAMNQILSRSNTSSHLDVSNAKSILLEPSKLQHSRSSVDNTSETSLFLSPIQPSDSSYLPVTFEYQNQVSIAESKAISFKQTTPKFTEDMSLIYKFLAILEWLLECTMMRDPTFAPSLYDYLKLPHRKLSYEKCVLASKNKQRINKLWLRTLDDPIELSFDSRPNSNTSLSPPSISLIPKSSTPRGNRYNKQYAIPKKKKIVSTETKKSQTHNNSTPRQTRLYPEELEDFLELLEAPPSQIRSSGATFKTEPIWVPNTMHGPDLDVTEYKDTFGEGSLQKSLVIHEQLAAMERARLASCEQKFEALRGTCKLWDEIQTMRNAVVAETAASARRKLQMNYHWYEDLTEIIPPDTRYDRYCLELLDNLKLLSEVSCQLGPSVMSRYRLVKVLSTLTPTDLDYPEVEMALTFVVNKIIYIASEDFANWKTHHRTTFDVTRANKWK
ncbi:Coiled-coil domain-containing protein 60-like [Oopsacas minuta]|uniref:Coiled-coil domain-containing protein 60-like n=1 Tax=Oopsacas minuta TaxID=111878 RepID=A0AAV7KII9_9METZ|nr:Coiled-coil domain-containing protein 60-like [Oopsacas minuta]